MTTEAARPPRRWARLLATLLLVALLLFFPIRFAVQLAADPEGPKDCAPSPPDDDGTKWTARDATYPPDVNWSQQGGVVNDASCLSRTAVYGVVRVSSVDDVRQALAFSRQRGLKVSPAGVKHSMGGHAFSRGGVVLDMRPFKRMSLDTATKTLRVESGATWHDIQNYLHPQGLAVKAMQSTDIFTVGGSISVNAHGMDHLSGSVGRTIRAMRVMMTDGTVQQVSATENPRLFDLVVGGYGLFGIILDVDLEVTDNAVYQSERRVIDYLAFPELLNREILPNPSYALLYGHLSTSPGNFLREMLVYVYRRVDAPDAVIPPLGEISQIQLRRLIFNLAKYGGLPMRLKWFAEKHVEPMLESCTVSRTQAMGDGEACFVSRNDPMHDSVPYLFDNRPQQTDILHEYFIPQKSYASFVDSIRSIMQEEDANLLNASVRVVHHETNALSYAPQDNMLAIVLYLNQPTNARGNEEMRRLTRRLIDACSDAGGRFFLPYQLHYTVEQLQRAYPEIAGFFAAKKEFDPEGLLTNTFYERYAPALTASSATTEK